MKFMETLINSEFQRHRAWIVPDILMHLPHPCGSDLPPFSITKWCISPTGMKRMDARTQGALPAGALFVFTWLFHALAL